MQSAFPFGLVPLIPRLSFILITFVLALLTTAPESGLFLFASAVTQPLDKNTLYALSGHVFVGTITDIETKMYIDPSNEEWREKHILLTIKVKTVLKSAKHTNSLSGDFDYQNKMSSSIDELVNEGSDVNVLTSSTVSLPKGWSGDLEQHESLKVGDVHTFYCTFVGKKRFQFDRTFPFVGGPVNIDTQGVEVENLAREDQQLLLSHNTLNAYLPLSPNGVGPIVGHEDRIDDAVVTAPETYHVNEEEETFVASDEAIEISINKEEWERKMEWNLAHSVKEVKSNPSDTNEL